VPNRSPSAILSPRELTELRRIAGGLTSKYGAVFVAMQLVKLDEGGGPAEAGTRKPKYVARAARREPV
jgi:hypothetical protein